MNIYLPNLRSRLLISGNIRRLWILNIMQWLKAQE